MPNSKIQDHVRFLITRNSLRNKVYLKTKSLYTYLNVKKQLEK